MRIKYITANEKQYRAVEAFFKSLGFKWIGGTESCIYQTDLPCVVLVPYASATVIARARTVETMGYDVTVDLRPLAQPEVVSIKLNNEYTAEYRKGDKTVSVGGESIPVDAILAVAEALK